MFGTLGVDWGCDGLKTNGGFSFRRSSRCSILPARIFHTPHSCATRDDLCNPERVARSARARRVGRLPKTTMLKRILRESKRIRVPTHRPSKGAAKSAKVGA